jgi:hypothetical protein
MPFALTSAPSTSEISEAINYLLGNFGANISADPNSGEITGPTGNVIGYLYKYLAVKYANSADGLLDFSDSPTNRLYFGLRNTNDTGESTNPTDYIWKQVAGGFGTTKFLFYQTNGGRQANILVDTVALNSSYIQDAGVAIDLDIVTTASLSKADNLVIYQWALSLPATPSGAAVYTWSFKTWSFTPAGWTLTPGTSPGAGYVLFSATVVLIDAVAATTTDFNWSLAAVSIAGSVGQAGNSSRICYAKTTSTSLSPTPVTITTSGSTSFPPFNTWGGSETWGATPPPIVAGESVYQSDGIYDPGTDLTTWNVPYLSNLKVGQLSAISANLGTITAGSLNINNKFIVAPTGDTTIQSGTTGARMEIKNNVIKVFDASGTLRVQIGDLSA